MTSPPSGGKGLDLSKPIGPLPTGAWIAIVVAGVGLVYWSRTHGLGGASSNQQPQTTTADTIGNGPGWVAVVPPTTAPASTDIITTNDAWSIEVITWLIAQGVQPTLADGAIRAYINGQDFPTGQAAQYQSIVDMALKHFGPPPQTLTPYTNPPGPIVNTPPPPPPANTPPPPPPNPTPGTTVRKFTVGKWPALDGSLGGIAILMYGNAARWPDIYNANFALINQTNGNRGPNWIFPGEVLTIP